jgi:hypothetical protein
VHPITTFRILVAPTEKTGLRASTQIMIDKALTIPREKAGNPFGGVGGSCDDGGESGAGHVSWSGIGAGYSSGQIGLRACIPPSISTLKRQFSCGFECRISTQAHVHQGFVILSEAKDLGLGSHPAEERRTADPSLRSG